MAGRLRGKVLTDRSLTWIAIVTITLVLGVMIYRGYWKDRESAGEDRRPVEVQEEEKPVTAVIARVRECNQLAGQAARSIELLGYVRNTGNTTLSLVTVQPVWKDRNGLVLGRGLVYVVKPESPLKPGEEREFQATTNLSRVTKCNVEPLDWGV